MWFTDDRCNRFSAAGPGSATRANNTKLPPPDRPLCADRCRAVFCRLCLVRADRLIDMVVGTGLTPVPSGRRRGRGDADVAALPCNFPSLRAPATDSCRPAHRLAAELPIRAAG